MGTTYQYGLMDLIWCLYCLMRWLLNHTDDRSNAQSANLQTDVCYVWLKVSMHLCVNYLTDYSGKTENNYTGRFKNQTMYLNSVDSFSLIINLGAARCIVTNTWTWLQTRPLFFANYLWWFVLRLHISYSKIFFNSALWGCFEATNEE